VQWIGSIFPDLIDQRFQRVDGNLFVVGFHFIGAAAGAFPGEVFEPLGGQERDDPAQYQAEGARNNQFNIIRRF